MKPGKLDEQPIPLIVTTLWFGICSSTRAFCTAASTPKSPHPGHQSGSTLPFKSAIARCFGVSNAVAMSSSSSNHNFVRGNRELGIPGQLFLHRFDNVMRHEWFAIVFADVSVRYEAGFAAQVAGKLPAVVVLDDDGVPRAL